MELLRIIPRNVRNHLDLCLDALSSLIKMNGVQLDGRDAVYNSYSLKHLK